MTPRESELAWYRKHGRHPDRIVRDSKGLEYVVGDYSWNRRHPSRKEFIEELMRSEGVYEVTKP